MASYRTPKFTNGKQPTADFGNMHAAEKKHSVIRVRRLVPKHDTRPKRLPATLGTKSTRVLTRSIVTQTTEKEQRFLSPHTKNFLHDENKVNLHSLPD